MTTYSDALPASGTSMTGDIRANVSASIKGDRSGWDVSWSLYLYATNNSGFPWQNSGANAWLDVGGTRRRSWSGGYDFPSGHGTGYTIGLGSGSYFLPVTGDGTGSLAVAFAFDDSGSLGAGSGSGTYTLPSILEAPNAPTAITSSYVSDSQASVGWTNNYPSNGAPVTNNLRESINGGAFAQSLSIAATSSVDASTAVNRKTIFQVNAENDTGVSAWSASSPAVFTTPAAPTDVAAAKDASLNIVVSLTPHVAFTEHEHVIVHGTVSGGVTAWDGSPLTALAAGTSTYTHTAPDSGSLHVYKISARNTDTGALTSAEVVSNTVQLLAAPNKPTLPALGPFVDKAKAFIPAWVHNPVDTTPQKAYELGYSTDGGSTWSTTGKITSTTSAKTFAASTYAADVALTVRVSTWGEATSGGRETTGASSWSDLATVTFKTRPVVTVTAPADAGTYTRSALTVALGFSQAESATFVNATIKLYDATPALLETLLSTTRASTLMDTAVDDGVSYSVTVTVIDSNGLVSDEAESDFSVAYTLPVPAVVTATYLPDIGWTQLGLTIASPGAGQVAATLVTIKLTIDGATETVYDEYPSASTLTLLDTFPTIFGTNDYTVTTISNDGATTNTLATVVTAEEEWGFLSTGEGFSEVVKFGGNFELEAAPSVDSTLFKAAGRSRPIALYGTTGDLIVTGSCLVAAGFGSTADELEAFLLIPGKAGYRDPSGKRIRGLVTGQVARQDSLLGSFSYTVTETS